MAIEQGNLDDLVSAGVERNDDKSYGDIFLGLLETGGELALKKRFAEQQPPTNRNASTEDTAQREIGQNLRERAQELATPRNIALAAGGVLGIIVVGLVLAKALK